MKEVGYILKIHRLRTVDKSGQSAFSQTHSQGDGRFLSPMFSIIAVWALIQPEAEFMFVKGREEEVVQKSQFTGQK